MDACGIYHVTNISDNHNSGSVNPNNLHNHSAVYAGFFFFGRFVFELHDIIFIHDKALTSDGFYAVLKSFAERNGSFEDIDEYEQKYIPNNPELFVLAVLDHVSLIRPKAGQQVKQAIDVVCSEAIYFRNKCEYSFVLLQQINRTSGSMDRRKAELQEIELQDLKDTAGPSEAADVVLALFFPHRDKMSVYRKYKIAKGFRDAFRSIITLKNRYGECDQIILIITPKHIIRLRVLLPKRNVRILCIIRNMVIDRS